MKIHEIFSMDAPVNPHNPSDEFISNCLIGVEHELEGARGDDFEQNFSAWNAIRDGSLRDSGIEYVLKAPLAGEALSEAINLLGGYVGGRRNICVNERTSTHIHMDARDMTPRQLLTFCVVYTTFEQAIFSMCDASRIENNFCVPVRKNAGVIHRLSQLSKNIDSSRAVENLSSDNYRYAALNMAALRRFGSLEFRMRESLTDPSSLKDWINIFLSIKEFSVANGNDPIQETLGRLSSLSPDKVSKFIFGEKLTALLGADGSLDEYVIEGVQLAQHIFHQQDVSLQEVASNCTLTDPKADTLCSIAEHLGTSKESFLSNIRHDPDQYYEYPPVDYSTVVYILKRGTADWWSHNIRKGRVITSRECSLDYILGMEATLTKPDVEERTGGLAMCNLLTQDSNATFEAYKASLETVSSNLFEDLGSNMSAPVRTRPQYNLGA